MLPGEYVNQDYGFSARYDPKLIIADPDIKPPLLWSEIRNNFKATNSLFKDFPHSQLTTTQCDISLCVLPCKTVLVGKDS